MAGKKVLIVYAHQEPRSFNGSLKKVAVEELSKQGCAITVSDLYAMDFEPRATRKDVIDRDLHLPVVIKTEEVMCGAQHLIGALSNPKFFNYGVEAYEAFKKRSLASDITDEQKKVQEADLVIFQNKLALLSLTTGGTAEMYGKTGVSGDFRYFLWPLQHGALHFCGFKVLAPQISFAPEIASEEERKAMVASWAQRLKTIWEEEPIDCTPAWYFGH
ncbi:ribosyldihydronicotinamide dehydrogenase [quinone] isoform X5 [Ailuropoda melanoleuca]|uniref:ribosyldihydronicotinamide dehydrogenase [quinone] isoform X5 n=1 Tax=Ailuropoda melanoleuca TaxID=9646 RepID=UPI001494B454|nr:ribosyldihydronicotinamide dehydrogenase [quinone] isoform X5 [Ailuropoda melanoleuca]